jgi:hypothetical protein
MVVHMYESSVCFGLNQGIYAENGEPLCSGKEKMDMAQCEVCGNEYDKAFQVSMPGEGTSTFDSFECAIHALAPTCEYCNVKVIGHGVEADGHFYCCAHCASMAGAEGVADRA